MANLFTVDFHRWRSVAGLSKVTIRQSFGNHTLFFLDYNITENQRYLLPPENTPFEVRFGSGPRGVRPSYGYVNHTEERADDQKRKFTRVVGVGTSKVMNTATPKTWTGLSRTGIIRDLGTRYRFRTLVHRHPEVLETWSSGSQSDFHVANTLADEMGFRLWVDGSTMWLLDPALLLSSASLGSTKVVRLQQQRAAQVLKGSSIPGKVKASKRTIQYGVHPATNEVFVSTSGEVGMPVEVLGTSVTSFGAARYDAQAVQKAAQDMAAITASFEGDSSVTPGTPVLFDQSVATPDQSGLWLVNEATHEISNKGFTTSVSASRDKDRRVAARVTDSVNRGRFVKSVIRNGKTWETEVQESVDV